jgi:hypothetical protein
MKEFPKVQSFIDWNTKIFQVPYVIDEFIDNWQEEEEKTGYSPKRTAIFGVKGSGKTSLLSWISQNTKYRVAEGDVLTIAARALAMEMNGNMTLGQAAQTNVSDNKTLWDTFDVQDAIQASEHLRHIHMYLDYFTAYRGSNSKGSIIMMPNYTKYVSFFGRRKDLMIGKAVADGKFAWADHIIESHNVLTVSMLFEKTMMYALKNPSYVYCCNDYVNTDFQHQFNNIDKLCKHF